jgi:hypothetical protein
VPVFPIIGIEKDKIDGNQYKKGTLIERKSGIEIVLIHRGKGVIIPASSP